MKSTHPCSDGKSHVEWICFFIFWLRALELLLCLYVYKRRQESESQKVPKCWAIGQMCCSKYPRMHDDKMVSLFIWITHKEIMSIAAALSTFKWTEWPDFLLRVFWKWRLKRRQQALTESCHCTEQKSSHKPLPVAWHLKVHVSSWHFLSTCLGNIGFHPLGPHFKLTLSGMMQEMQTTSVAFSGGTH